MCEKLGEPYQVNGKFYQRIKKTCPICCGKGFCFFCNDTGYKIEEQRILTKEEKEKKAADAINFTQADPLTPQEKWLINNGFSKEGKTYLILGNTFSIKDNLKQLGFRYQPYIKWHAAEPFKDTTYQSKEISAYDFYSWSKEQKCFLLTEEGKQKLEQIYQLPQLSSTSEWFGAIGEKFSKIKVKLVSRNVYSGFYGEQENITFIDEKNNVFTWQTSSFPEFKAQIFYISGTIKKHITNKKGIKVTLITRVKAEATI